MTDEVLSPSSLVSPDLSPRFHVHSKTVKGRKNPESSLLPPPSHPSGSLPLIVSLIYVH